MSRHFYIKKRELGKHNAIKRVARPQFDQTGTNVLVGVLKGRAEIVCDMVDFSTLDDLGVSEWYEMPQPLALYLCPAVAGWLP